MKRQIPLFNFEFPMEEYRRKVENFFSIFIRNLILIIESI